MRLKSCLLSNFSILLVVFSFITISAEAIVPIIHKSPKPEWILPCKGYFQKPSERNIKNGAYSELVEEQINIEKKATYNHIIIQIVSGAGVQNNSEIAVDFEPRYQQLDFHEIIVWRNNKPTSRLNIDSFKILAEENELEKFIYNGTYSAKYILPDIRKGDKIEYSYTITGTNPIFNNKFCRSIYLQGSDLIEHQYTTLLYPSGRSINMKSFNLLSQPKVTNANGLIRYEWEDFQVPGISVPEREAKWVNQYARVQVSEYKSWADVINWGLAINPIKTDLKGELADSISEIKRKYGSNKERYFRAAVRLVQDEVRYMGIETGQYSHKANSPDKVFNKRYGDCKDKSLLLASILNACGIEAHLVLLNTEIQDKIENFIPSAILFDHAVVTAKVNDKQVWIDATMANQGGKGVDIYFPPYREGLILKAGNTGLTKINETNPGKITCEENYQIANEFSPVKLTVKTIRTLGQADDIRDGIASSGTAQTEKNYLEYYSKTYEKIKATDSLIIKDDKEKNEFITIENYTIPNFFKLDSAEQKYTANFYADYISEQLPEVSGQVKTPISVNYPYDIDYTVAITLPMGWDMANEHYSLKRDAYKFVSDKTVSDDKLSLHYQFTYLNNYIAQDKLSEYKGDVKDLKDDKLSFNFFYIPNIKVVPFQVNKLMLVIATMVIGLFVYGGLRIYQKETSESNYYSASNSFAPALGGWLIVLVIILIATPLSLINTMIENRYFSIIKWDLVTTGVKSVANRSLLLFETVCHLSLICYSIFCLILVLKKRDISPYMIKIYYLCLVVFLFIDYFFYGYVNGEFSSYAGEQIFKAVVLAVCWTYYLNTSNRVKSTFVVPYPH